MQANPLRLPVCVDVIRWTVCQASYAATIRVHHIDLVVAITIRVKEDLRAVRRPVGFFSSELAMTKEVVGKVNRL